MAETYSPNLDHFLQLARRGEFAGCSSGEKRCHELAKAVMEHAVGIDESALIGFSQFALLVNTSYPRAQKLLIGED